MRQPNHTRGVALAEPLERRFFLDGDLAADWAAGGIFFLKPTYDVANVAPRPDGSVILHALRYSNDEFLYRLDAGGAVDLNYGDIDGGEPRGGFDVAAQSDNRLLYATGDAVVRFSASGVREEEFRGPLLHAGPETAVIDAFVILPDNSFAAAGHIDPTDPPAPAWNGIEWFSADGSHRTSIELDDPVVSLAGQADGKLVALIRTSGGYVLKRFTSTGQLDPSFANDTLFPAPVRPDFPSSRTEYSSVSIDGVGRIYVGGHLPVTDADNTPLAVVRLLTGGEPDPSYGEGGLAARGPAAVVGRGAAFRVAPDGRMYVAATLWPHEEDFIVTVWRLRADGAADSTWGANGIAQLDVTLDTNAIAEVGDLEFLPDGDVVVSGSGARAAIGTPRNEIGYVFRLDVDAAPAEIFNDNGVLTIIGRPIGDTIYMKTLADGRISATANDATRIFAASSVEAVSIIGGGGDDYIDLRALKPLASATADFPVTVSGDAGKDAIVGSQDADRLVGGDANDRLAGMEGDDWISGSAQSDRISGGAGNDLILGNGGRDYLSGDEGADILRGGDQPDVLAGGDDDDQVLGEGGHDHLHGNAGADSFWGGGGNDTFFAVDGVIETLIGGSAGADTAYADHDDILVSIETPILP